MVVFLQRHLDYLFECQSHFRYFLSPAPTLCLAPTPAPEQVEPQHEFNLHDMIRKYLDEIPRPEDW